MTPIRIIAVIALILVGCFLIWGKEILIPLAIIALALNQIIRANQ